METSGTLLKALLRQKHWQKHETFRRQYDKAAATVDRSLIGSAPESRTLRRWISGQVRLPHSDHCRVLEAMFPGFSADQLFELFDSAVQPTPAAGRPDAGMVWTRPPRLSFGGVCIWCDHRDCVDRVCLELHESTRWEVCPLCKGAPWSQPDSCCCCLYGLSESVKFAVSERVTA